MRPSPLRLSSIYHARRDDVATRICVHFVAVAVLVRVLLCPTALYNPLAAFSSSLAKHLNRP